MSSSTDTKATSVSSQAVFFMERDECLRLIHEISSPDHVVVEDVEQAKEFMAICKIVRQPPAPARACAHRPLTRLPAHPPHPLCSARSRAQLDKYQEQAQLLDPHLDSMMGPIMARVRHIVRQREADELAAAAAAADGGAASPAEEKEGGGLRFCAPAAEAQLHRLLQLVYQLCKTRGPKTVVKLFPHEVADVEPTLHVLQQCRRSDFRTWETRYCLLLWVSMLSLVPFDLATIDSAAPGAEGIVDSIIGLCKRYLSDPGRARLAAATCLSMMLTRPDMEAARLEQFAEWARDALLAATGVGQEGGVGTVLGAASAAAAAGDDDDDDAVARGAGGAAAQALGKGASSLGKGASVAGGPGAHVFMQLGVLTSLTEIFKRGRREKLLTMVPALFEPLLLVATTSAASSNTLLRKLVVKLVQRVGLIFMPPRVLSWRYQRGKRSLLQNLENKSDNGGGGGGGGAVPAPMPPTAAAAVAVAGAAAGAVAEAADAADAADALPTDADGFILLPRAEIPPPQMDEVVEVLLCGLRDRDTVVRWSAAKGIGRITERLPELFADDVVAATLELFDEAAEGDGAWHGGCLALAELARRGLLLPSRLPNAVPVVARALAYDVRRGSHSVGAHVRDAAAYVCWAFARAYDPAVLAPFVPSLAASMLQCATFDREVNCRRAASAAFQENVGRQGADSFAHGIAIMTVADYATLGNRQAAFLRVSRFVAAVGGGTDDAAGAAHPYRRPLLRFLVQAKLLSHWDTELRELAAHSIFELAALDPRWLAGDAEVGLPRLLAASLSPELHVRHGAALGAAELLLALSRVPAPAAAAAAGGGGGGGGAWLGAELQKDVRNLVPRIEKARLYRGRGGEAMRVSVCRVIECCAHAHANDTLPLPPRAAERLLDSLLDCLKQPKPEIQAAAAAALRPLAANYCVMGGGGDPLQNWRARVLVPMAAALGVALRVGGDDGGDGGGADFKRCRVDPNPAVRRGAALALGVLPTAMFGGGARGGVCVDAAVAALERASLPEPGASADEQDAEMRQNAVWGLAQLLGTLGVDHRAEPAAEGVPSDDDALPAGLVPVAVCRRACDTLLTALEDDYSADSRGDVGSWIRIAAIRALESVARLLLASRWRRRWDAHGAALERPLECGGASGEAAAAAAARAEAGATDEGGDDAASAARRAADAAMAGEQQSAAAAAAVAAAIAKAEEEKKAKEEKAAAADEDEDEEQAGAGAAGADGGGGGLVDRGVGDRSVEARAESSGGGTEAWAARRRWLLAPWRAPRVAAALAARGGESAGDDAGEAAGEGAEDDACSSALSARLVAALLKQLGEKLDVVRRVTGGALSRLLQARCPLLLEGGGGGGHTLPLLPFVPHRGFLESLLLDGGKKTNWASATRTFPMLVPALRLRVYRDAVVEGLVVSVGGLTESVVKAATAALLGWAVAEKERATLGEGDGGEDNISGLGEALLRVLVARGDTPRVCLPLLRTLDVLFNNGIFNLSLATSDDGGAVAVAAGEAVARSWGRRLLEALRAVLKGCTDVVTLLAAARVLLGLIALRGARAGGADGEAGIRPGALQNLLLLLGHRYPKVSSVCVCVLLPVCSVARAVAAGVAAAAAAAAAAALAAAVAAAAAGAAAAAAAAAAVAAAAAAAAAAASSECTSAPLGPDPPPSPPALALSPQVRKVVAEQFYTVGLIIDDLVPEEALDTVLNILSETAWDGARGPAQTARDLLFPLLGVPKPAAAARKAKKVKEEKPDELESYAALVAEMGY